MSLSSNSHFGHAEDDTDVEKNSIEESKDAHSTKTSTELDWDGPDDPENPLNWPKWKRYGMVPPLAFMSLAASIGSSIVAPAATTLMLEYNVSLTVSILPLSLYVVALGLGPILAAPISETRGRHIVYMISLPLGCLFSIGAAEAPSFAALCVLRFFAGLAFSPALAVGAGTIVDLLAHGERAIGATLYVTCPFLGPALGPVIGSFAVVQKGWRWTQWIIVIFGAAAFLFVMVFMRETYKKAILEKRNKKRGLPPPPSPYASKGEALHALLTVVLIRPLHMLFTEPIVGCFSLYVAFNFSTLFTFFAAFPYVFETVYFFTTEQSGLVFLAVAIGSVLAMITTILCDRLIYQKHMARNNGQPIAPEYRLYPALLGSFGLPISLFWFAWTARADVHWAVPVVAAVPFAWGNLSVFLSAAMYLVDTYQSLTGASAMAANGLARYILGAAFPLFTIQMYENLGINWATSLLGFISLALLPIPWVLMKYGRKIRMMSKYDTVDW